MSADFLAPLYGECTVAASSVFRWKSKEETHPLSCFNVLEIPLSCCNVGARRIPISSVQCELTPDSCLYGRTRYSQTALIPCYSSLQSRFWAFRRPSRNLKKKLRKETKVRHQVSRQVSVVTASIMSVLHVVNVVLSQGKIPYRLR